ncbi:MAG TPA: hypothetical protein IAB60_11850 [Candidatus Caccovicinus merdipullorum]|uniref:Uncharacterized protein n=1 Tax=Candidatus Caccovicinus merdipullorum TaxID=2840724 RepID=A0A9D1GL58_9FIRM|nr:hypothetical protein [Candidatus Caccovicinus merdipullorum]
MRISFKEFHRFLSEDDYTDKEIRHLFHAVKAMDQESRRWVLRWFNQGSYPDQEIEGVTAKYLVETCGYRPLNALIILDWLKADPQAAKYFVLKIPSTIPPGEAIGEEIEKIMEAEGIPVQKAEEEEELGDIL